MAETNIDEAMSDFSELETPDKEFNFIYFVNQIEMKLLAALSNPNIVEGCLQYQSIVRHFETLCRAAKKIPEDYDKIVKDKVAEIEKQQEAKTVKEMRSADAKLEILLSHVIEGNPMKQGLRVHSIKPRKSIN